MVMYCVAEGEEARPVWNYAFYEISDGMKCKLEIPSRAVWEIQILWDTEGNGNDFWGQNQQPFQIYLPVTQKRLFLAFYDLMWLVL